MRNENRDGYMNHPILTAALALAICGPAGAVNKCTGADGRVLFQDAPCSGKGESLNVRPARGAAPAAAPATAPADGSAAGATRTEAQRLEGLISESQRLRKVQEYELRIVPGAQSAIANQRRQCDAQLQALKDKKRLANDNLAGATWESSISTEMTAVATRCDTYAAELRADLETRRKECQALGGCK
jgi:hypothetical protein